VRWGWGDQHWGEKESEDYWVWSFVGEDENVIKLILVMVESMGNALKTTESCALSGRITRRVNYISSKLLRLRTKTPMAAFLMSLDILPLHSCIIIYLDF
jgi:hypothetical protein